MNPYISLPITALLVYRSHTHSSLTPLGILFAALTALIHALHPWPLPFTLLCTFFLTGTFVTKIHHGEKSRLTLSASGSSGGGGDIGGRTHIQVLANSGAASLLILLHLYLYKGRSWLYNDKEEVKVGLRCWAYGAADVIPVGIVANYAAVAADTFASELGILSKSAPRLVTSLRLRKVPPGTNGGVTMMGLGAGFLGSGIIAVVSGVLMPFCREGKTGFEGGYAWGLKERVAFVVGVTVWGGLGSVLDSFLGGWMQASVIDKKSGKVVEGRGGKKVIVYSEAQGKGKSGSRKVESGLDLLDNNGVNFLMAGIMSLTAMSLTAWVWSLPPDNIFVL